MGMTAAVTAGTFLSPAVADAGLLSPRPVLRVCADPDNLPFSQAEGPEKGLYVELAELVGERLQAQIEYVWWLSYYQKRALRNTLLAGGCDAYFALPANAEYMGKSIARTRSFLNLGYAVVASPSLAFSSLADLKSKRLAVQFNTTPHIFLSGREGWDVSTFRKTEEIFAALAQRQVDAAFLWGPEAGYENKTRYGNAWRVTPLIGPDMEGQVAVGVKKGNDTLRASLDKALADLRPDIARLADKYGFPSAQAVNVDMTTDALPIKTVVAETQTATGKSDRVGEGRELFNNHCSHCHAPNAISPIRERDLRRLSLRYGDKWREVASVTIKNGRPDYGMPPWKELLNDERIGILLSFFETIQQEP